MSSVCHDGQNFAFVTSTPDSKFLTLKRNYAFNFPQFSNDTPCRQVISFANQTWVESDDKDDLKDRFLIDKLISISFYIVLRLE